MPQRILLRTVATSLSVGRMLLLTLVVYVVIRLAIPWLVQGDVPFWARAIFLALVFPTSAPAGPWLYPRRR